MERKFKSERGWEKTGNSYMERDLELNRGWKREFGKGIEMGMGIEMYSSDHSFFNPKTHERGLTLPYTYKMRCNGLILSCFIPEKRDTPPIHPCAGIVTGKQIGRAHV